MSFLTTTVSHDTVSLERHFLVHIVHIVRRATHGGWNGRSLDITVPPKVGTEDFGAPTPSSVSASLDDKSFVKVSAFIPCIFGSQQTLQSKERGRIGILRGQSLLWRLFGTKAERIPVIILIIVVILGEDYHRPSIRHCERLTEEDGSRLEVSLSSRRRSPHRVSLSHKRCANERARVRRSHRHTRDAPSFGRSHPRSDGSGGRTMAPHDGRRRGRVTHGLVGHGLLLLLLLLLLLVGDCAVATAKSPHGPDPVSPLPKTGDGPWHTHVWVQVGASYTELRPWIAGTEETTSARPTASTTGVAESTAWSVSLDDFDQGTLLEERRVAWTWMPPVLVPVDASKKVEDPTAAFETASHQDNNDDDDDGTTVAMQGMQWNVTGTVTLDLIVPTMMLSSQNVDAVEASSTPNKQSTTTTWVVALWQHDTPSATTSTLSYSSATPTLLARRLVHVSPHAASVSTHLSATVVVAASEESSARTTTTTTIHNTSTTTTRRRSLIWLGVAVVAILGLLGSVVPVTLSRQDGRWPVPQGEGDEWVGLNHPRAEEHDELDEDYIVDDLDSSEGEHDNDNNSSESESDDDQDESVEDTGDNRGTPSPERCQPLSLPRCTSSTMADGLSSDDDDSFFLPPSLERRVVRNTGRNFCLAVTELHHFYESSRTSPVTHHPVNGHPETGSQNNNNNNHTSTSADPVRSAALPFMEPPPVQRRRKRSAPVVAESNGAAAASAPTRKIQSQTAVTESHGVNHGSPGGRTNDTASCLVAKNDRSDAAAMDPTNQDSEALATTARTTSGVQSSSREPLDRASVTPEVDGIVFEKPMLCPVVNVSRPTPTKASLQNRIDQGVTVQKDDISVTRSSVDARAESASSLRVGNTFETITPMGSVPESNGGSSFGTTAQGNDTMVGGGALPSSEGTIEHGSDPLSGTQEKTRKTSRKGTLSHRPLTAKTQTTQDSNTYACPASPASTLSSNRDKRENATPANQRENHAVVTARTSELLDRLNAQQKKRDDGLQSVAPKALQFKTSETDNNDLPATTGKRSRSVFEQDYPCKVAFVDRSEPSLYESNMPSEECTSRQSKQDCTDVTPEMDGKAKAESSRFVAVSESTSNGADSCCLDRCVPIQLEGSSTIETKLADPAEIPTESSHNRAAPIRPNLEIMLGRRDEDPATAVPEASVLELLNGSAQVDPIRCTQVRGKKSGKLTVKGQEDSTVATQQSEETSSKPTLAVLTHWTQDSATDSSSATKETSMISSQNSALADTKKSVPADRQEQETRSATRSSPLEDRLNSLKMEQENELEIAVSEADNGMTTEREDDETTSKKKRCRAVFENDNIGEVLDGQQKQADSTNSVHNRGPDKVSVNKFPPYESIAIHATANSKNVLPLMNQDSSYSKKTNGAQTFDLPSRMSSKAKNSANHFELKYRVGAQIDTVPRAHGIDDFELHSSMNERRMAAHSPKPRSVFGSRKVTLARKVSRTKFDLSTKIRWRDAASPSMSYTSTMSGCSDGQDSELQRSLALNFDSNTRMQLPSDVGKPRGHSSSYKKQPEMKALFRTHVTRSSESASAGTNDVQTPAAASDAKIAENRKSDQTETYPKDIVGVTAPARSKRTDEFNDVARNSNDSSSVQLMSSRPIAQARGSDNSEACILSQVGATHVVQSQKINALADEGENTDESGSVQFISSRRIADPVPEINLSASLLAAGESIKDSTWTCLSSTSGKPTPITTKKRRVPQSVRVSGKLGHAPKSSCLDMKEPTSKKNRGCGSNRK